MRILPFSSFRSNWRQNVIQLIFSCRGQGTYINMEAEINYLEGLYTENNHLSLKDVYYFLSICRSLLNIKICEIK